MKGYIEVKGSHKKVDMIIPISEIECVIKERETTHVYLIRRGGGGVEGSMLETVTPFEDIKHQLEERSK